MNSALKTLCSTTLILLLLWTAVVCAEQRELATNNKEKIDAVVVLDASGSMLVNDPLRLRDEGAKLFTQFLKSGDRLAIIEFSTTANILHPLSEYSEEQKEQISGEISKIGNLGQYTDILAALKSAKSILEQNQREDSSQSIILLSDGKMDPDPALGSPSGRTQELIDDFLPDLKSKGIKVYTLSFSEQADKELLSQIAAATDAVSWFTPTADKIHQSFADLFLVVKKPQIVPLTSKGFNIDANIDEATFYINREDGADISLKAPDGSTITKSSFPSNVKWSSSQKFDLITIVKPAVGTWQVSGLSSTDGFATVLTNLKLVIDWPVNVYAGGVELLQARLYEGEKPVVLPEMTGVTQYLFQVVPTDRVSEPIIKDSLNDDGKGGDKIELDGIFSANLSLEEPGDYKLKVLARSPTFERSQQLPFRLKPRLVSLSIDTIHEQRSLAQAAAKKEEESKHAADKHGEEAHGQEDQPKAGHEPEHPEHAQPNSKEYFRVELSPETAALKKVQVKLLAIDDNKNRFKVPLSQSSESSFVFEAPASSLPHDGEYELQATMSGLNKSQKEQTGESQIIRFNKVPGEVEHEIVQHVEEPKVEVPQEAPPGPWVGLVIVTLLNGAAFFVLYSQLKKSQTQLSFAVPDFGSLADVTTVMNDLRKRMELAEADVNDPMFSEESLKALPIRAAGSAQAESEPASEVAEPVEEAAQSEEPPEEKEKEAGEKEEAAEEEEEEEES